MRLHAASPGAAWRRCLPVLCVVLLAACGTTPPAPTATAAPSSGSVSLAGRLRDAVNVDAIRGDLDRLQQIAGANGGIRAAGTPGYDASAAFVARSLGDLGYRVRMDEFTVPSFSEVGTSLLTVPGGPELTAGRDFRAMLFSAGGDVRARVEAIGFDRSADPGAFGVRPSGLGCSPGDMPASVRGTLVLVQPGPCYRRVQALAAEAAGALAIVIAYPQWEPGFVLRPTLLSPDGITIPVIGATREAGLALADAADARAQIHLQVATLIVQHRVANVIADTPAGDPSKVVMLGAHLDSVIDGPGINDNGSGTMTILEIARRLAQVGPFGETVRFAFWAGEELGLYGSQHYVGSLSAADRARIVAYLNFDMLGSPNGGRLVYADAGAVPGSDRITAAFTAYFASSGLSSATLDLGGASDHYAFEQAGIPTGGLFSGANELKTAAAAQQFGGAPNTLFDGCYHRPCDRSDNIDPTLLAQMARAAAYVTGLLASGELALSS